ncbi:SDR family NAD(P)-dependent oxidoreductase [Streptomyces coeruleofuscus]|uniref:SDR family NAD(P)-dependent oxidoreductase n=1 Tax=Streptomyces coeruleofuscus TaxID=66879 RepID=A0ABP5W444_9ACTN
MQTSGISAVVTGGASGLGLATARRLLKAGARVTIADLPSSDGERAVRDLGPEAVFVPADVTSTEDMTAVLDTAERTGALRAVVHCAGRGGPLRVVNKDGTAGDLDHFRAVVDVNLIGTFNVLRLAAARMARNEPLDGDRGVVVMTASVAAFEGQIGQAPYAASKAGVAGLTVCVARDLASKSIRVVTIAPGLFDTPMLGRRPKEKLDALAAAVPHPPRLGAADEYAQLALHIIDNPMLNGETIRLDGAIRLAPR